MTDQTLNDQARRLRALHQEDAPLLLPNAWDAGSAALVAAAGAAAVATTSAGASWSLGRPDGQALSRDAMVQLVARVAAVVDVPVTADVEAGYGTEPADVAETVTAATAAGAAGINLEDSRAVPGPLFTVAEQAARIAAARRAATAAGVPDLVVNARTDVFLFQIGEPAGRYDEVVARAKEYAAAGADCLFVPGLLDLEVLRRLTAEVALPVNVMAAAGAPSVAELAAAGVRRISVGSALAQVAYGAARRAAEEVLTSGTFDTYRDAVDFGTINGAF